MGIVPLVADGPSFPGATCSPAPVAADLDSETLAAGHSRVGRWFENEAGAEGRCVATDSASATSADTLGTASHSTGSFDWFGAYVPAMTDWTDEYADTDDLNRKYELLRAEITRLRDRRADVEFFDDDAVERDVRRLNDAVAGELIVFVANDFGMPRAYRPNGVAKDVQDEIRRAILRDKYDGTNEDLDDVRTELLAEHPGVHKAVVAEYADGTVRYHLPEGSNETTNFVTVREMVGLVDYTTNSSQSDGLSRTY